MQKSLGMVWVPHPTQAWVPARLTDEGDVLKYTTNDGEVLEFKPDEIKKDTLDSVTEEELTGEGMENLVNLGNFSQGGVLNELRKRYVKDLIYTGISTILISVNPYRMLPIYHSAIVEEYRTNYTEMPPHVYKIGADAYKRMLDEQEDQAVIISGESGAGKTEATKAVLQYLSDVAGSTNNVEQQILQSNPVLEAFGNAKTNRNNNSSRFGKWMEVVFQIGGRICAARIVNYLLEKSRVVGPGEGERNYHIFYQICKGLTTPEHEKYSLGKMEDYRYLKSTGGYDVKNMDDIYEFSLVTRAFKQLGFLPDETEGLYTITSSVLNLGNIEFQPKVAQQKKGKGDGSEVVNKGHLEALGKLMQVDPVTLETALTFRTLSVRGSISMVPLVPADATSSVDALAKGLYGGQFDWLVKRVNTALAGDSSGKGANTIGILDIFGFEIFVENSFEQFCINYCNEKLQQHFNNHIFKLEQAEYKEEGINVGEVTFVDNLECLELIEQNNPKAGKTGILAMLDEEVSLPKGSDESFIAKMHEKFADKKSSEKSSFYDNNRKKPSYFTINHYAGGVEYNSVGWMDKNKDTMPDSLRDLVMKSGVALIKLIFEKKTEEAPAAAEAEPEKKKGGRRAQRGPAGGAKTKTATLAGQFKAQLKTLMETLTKCNPHYIRCVKPNTAKEPGVFDGAMILQQMQYAGLFEAIRIRQAGFPFRKDHKDFNAHFRLCLSHEQRDTMDTKADEKSKSEYMLGCFAPQVDPAGVAVGKTKVLLRNEQRVALSKLRDRFLTTVVERLQAFARGAAARDWFSKYKKFNDECVATASSRDIAALNALLAHATKLEYKLAILPKLILQVEYLQEEARVLAILSESIAENEITTLEAALEQAVMLKQKYPTCTQSEEFNSTNAKAQASKDAIIRMDKARKGLAAAVVSESMDELKAAIEEAKAASLKEEEWEKAKTLLEQLEFEAQLITAVESATAAATADGSRANLDVLEGALEESKQVTLDDARSNIVNSGKEVHFKGWFALLKAQMEKAKADISNHLPNHTVLIPAASMEVAPEDKVVQELIEKLEQLKYADLVEQAQTHLAAQVEARSAGHMKAHLDYMNSVIKNAEADTKANVPTYESVTPVAELPLPQHEKTLKENVIPNLAKVGFQDFVSTAQSFLDTQLKTRIAQQLNAHSEYLDQQIQLAEEDFKSNPPTAELDAVPPPSAPAKIISDRVIPNLTKLKYAEQAERAKLFVTNIADKVKGALETAHFENLNMLIKKAQDEAPGFMPTKENPAVPPLPATEAEVTNNVLPKLQKLGFTSLLATATSSLEALSSAREKESAKIKAEIAEQERLRKEAEEAARKAEERKALDEQARKKAEEEERLKKEKEDAERKKAQELERKREEAEEARRKKEADDAKAAAEAEQKKRMEEQKEKEEAAAKAKAEEEAKRKAAAEAAKKEAEEQAIKKAAAEAKAAADIKAKEESAAAAAKQQVVIPEIKHTIKIDSGMETELKQAADEKDLAKLRELLKDPVLAESQTHSARVARKVLQTLEDQEDIIQHLNLAIMDFDSAKIKNLIKEAGKYNMENKVVEQAKKIAFGMSTNDLFKTRLELCIQQKDLKKVKAILEEAEAKGVVNDATEDAKEYIRVRNEQIQRGHIGETALPEEEQMSSALKAYRDWQSYAGLFPLKRCKLIRAPDEYAKGKPLELKQKRLVWQIEDLPSTLVKLNAKYCGSVKKSKLIKRVGKLLFKNIRYYMGDRYHAYPSTLAFQVVETCVGEPLLRDEVYAQLVKQTTQNPSPESELMGFKLMYLCLQAFKPSAHLLPIVNSHLASVCAPWNLRKFGWRDPGELAFQCYMLLSESADGTGKTPSMSQIDKVTSGGLPLVKSPFQEDIGLIAAKGAAGKGKGALKKVETKDKALSGALTGYFRDKSASAAANKNIDEMNKQKYNADMNATAAKVQYMAPKVMAEAGSHDKSTMKTVNTQVLDDGIKDAFVREQTLARAANADHSKLNKVEKKGDMSSAMMKAEYAREKTQATIGSEDPKAALKQTQTKDEVLEKAKEAYVAEQKFYKEAPKNMADAIEASAADRKLNKVEKTQDMSQAAAKAAYLAPKIIDNVATVDLSTLKKTETKDEQNDFAKMAYSREKTMGKLESGEAQKDLKQTEAMKTSAADAALKTAYLQPKVSQQAAATDHSTLNEVAHEADMSSAFVKADYAREKTQAVLEKGDIKLKKNEEGVKDTSNESAKEAYLAEQKFYKEAPKTLAESIAANAADGKASLKRQSKNGDMTSAAMKAEYLRPAMLKEAVSGEVKLNKVTLKSDMTEDLNKAAYRKEKTLATIAEVDTDDMRKVETVDNSQETIKTAYAHEKTLEALNTGSRPELKAVTKDADMSAVSAKMAYLQPMVASHAAMAAERAQLNPVETNDTSLESAREAFLSEKKALQDAPKSLVEELSKKRDSQSALKKTKTESNATSNAKQQYALEKTQEKLQSGEEKKRLKQTKTEVKDSATQLYAHEKTQAAITNVDLDDLDKVKTKDETLDITKTAYLTEKNMKAIEGGEKKLNKVEKNADMAAAATRAQYSAEKTMVALSEGKTKKLKEAKDGTKDTSLDSAKEAFLAEQKFYKEAPKNIMNQLSEGGEETSKKLKKVKGTRDTSNSTAKVAFLAPKMFDEIEKSDGKKKLAKTQVREGNEASSNAAFARDAALTKISKGDTTLKKSSAEGANDFSAAVTKTAYLAPKAIAGVAAFDKSKLKESKNKGQDMSMKAIKASMLGPKAIEAAAAHAADESKKLKETKTKDTTTDSAKEAYLAEKKFLREAPKNMSEAAAGMDKSRLKKVKTKDWTQLAARQEIMKAKALADAANMDRSKLKKTETKAMNFRSAFDAYAQAAKQQFEDKIGPKPELDLLAIYRAKAPQ
eukprot:gb/GEZN01000053.1/.p1 GENE.gb/GEZN01000053.1/~~gb/GEZN01000053.1/.p1  ORF type:complete len:2897 (+),score=759.98 gb/GEZN01000053.1/:46-8736(+)